MSNQVDYTPVLLAQLTDLQMRVTKQDSIIQALKAEIERMTGHSLSINDTMKTSIPLRLHDNIRNNNRHTHSVSLSAPVPSSTTGHLRSSNGRTRPRVAPTTTSTTAHPTLNLSDILRENEKVTVVVHTGKNSEGSVMDATAVALFDGKDLVVKECELVESIVGLKTGKPGEILYKFIDELKTKGHIKRTFSIAPWKLCFVERDGLRLSLEELRHTLG
jgi:hypothetical protein